MSTGDATKFPWKWSTMTDHELHIWLLGVAAGKDASRESPLLLAQTDWPKNSNGQPDVTKLPRHIYLGSKARRDADGRYAGTWWDFDRCVGDIRKYFPYATQAQDAG